MSKSSIGNKKGKRTSSGQTKSGKKSKSKNRDKSGLDGIVTVPSASSTGAMAYYGRHPKEREKEAAYFFSVTKTKFVTIRPKKKSS